MELFVAPSSISSFSSRVENLCEKMARGVGAGRRIYEGKSGYIEFLMKDS